MGHLGDVLHALLTADAVLTYATQWFSFPAFCFSLVAHSCHSTYGSENPTEGTSKVREHQIEGTHKVGKIRIEGNMIFFVVPTRGTPLLKGVDLEILKLLQLRYLRISQKSLYPVGTDGKNGGEAGRLADSYAVVNGRLWSHATAHAERAARVHLQLQRDHPINSPWCPRRARPYAPVDRPDDAAARCV